MIEEEESGKSFNLFEVLNKQVAPVFHRLKKWLWIPLLLGILLFVLGYWMENRKSPEFTAKITFMLEDEVLGEGGKAGGNDILSMLSGRAPQSNKGIMVDLAQSNHLVEQTLLRTDTIEKKPQVLANYFMDVFGYNIKGLSFSSNYKPGSNEEKDRWLRTFSSMIIFNLKAKVQESGVIKAEYSCSNENFAKVFLDNHLITISDFYILKKVERAKVLLVLTKRRRDSLQMLLQGKTYGTRVQHHWF